jgi:raffinose/stachyose/melibiose transport system substrate-binding protein
LLNSQDPPAVFTADSDTDLSRLAEEGIIDPADGGSAAAIEDIESAIPVRLDAKGLAADRRVLAQLIGQEDPAEFISDLKAADQSEWSNFIALLSRYITYGSVSGFDLNHHSYQFAEEKGALVTELTGVFAASGADLSFLGRELLDRTLATTDPDVWTSSAGKLAEEAAAADTAASGSALGLPDAAVPASALPEANAPAIDEPDVSDPETESETEPDLSEADILTNSVFDAYIASLSEITQDIAGFYAPGVRGDDFISEEYYSEAKAKQIFASGRAVFTDVSDADFEIMKDLDAIQSKSLALFPLKIPYALYGLESAVDGVEANRAVPVRVTEVICVNKSLSNEAQEQARLFVDWFVASENYGEDAVMREAADYYRNGDTLPYEEANSEYAVQMESFAETISERDGLPLYLSDQQWDAAKLAGFRSYLKSAWSNNLE